MKKQHKKEEVQHTRQKKSTLHCHKDRSEPRFKTTTFFYSSTTGEPEPKITTGGKKSVSTLRHGPNYDKLRVTIPSDTLKSVPSPASGESSSEKQAKAFWGELTISP